jgi:hypothetical protein
MTTKHNSLILASAARTASPTVPSLDQALLNASTQNMSDIHIVIDVTLDAAAASVQPALEAYDDVSDSWYALVTAPAAITAVGTTTIRYGENTPVLANQSNQGFIPSVIRLTLTHADTDAITYSVSANFVIR